MDNIMAENHVALSVSCIEILNESSYKSIYYTQLLKFCLSGVAVWCEAICASLCDS